VSSCSVCGNKDFLSLQVLDPQLISDWQLNEEEVSIIDAEQGFVCNYCGVNWRAQALAQAIMNFTNFDGIFKDFVASRRARSLRILEINSVGLLSPFLEKMRGNLLVEYPDVDIHNLKFPSNSFDLVLTSDTLEHVEHPDIALEQIFNVLKINGASIFTVPFIWSRLTRNRSGLSDSFHGDPILKLPDYKVHWEFGSDIFKFPLEVGFSRVELLTLNYPNGLAFTCYKQS
jgi:SAM-dependent methyltransferase